MKLYVASILLRPTELGGRRNRLPSGYLADVTCDGRRIRVRVLWIGADSLGPGLTGLALLRPVDPDEPGVDVGAQIELLEGVREVAAGRVIASAPALGMEALEPPKVQTESPMPNTEPEHEFDVLFVPVEELRRTHGAGATDARAPSAGDLILPRAEVSGLVITGVPYRSIVVKGTTVVDAQVSGATVRFRAGLAGDQAVFRNCRFSHARLQELGNARFERCFFDDVHLPTEIGFAEFVECTFEGDVEGVRFDGVPSAPAAIGRETNEFRGNDFTRAALLHCAFRHVDLRAQRWPEKSRCRRLFVRPSALAEIERRVAHGSVNEDASHYVRWFKDYYAGQSEIVVSIDDLAPAARFWRLLLELSKDLT